MRKGQIDVRWNNRWTEGTRTVEQWADCQKRLTEASHSKNDNIMLSEKLKDMESELSQLRKQVGFCYNTQGFQENIPFF